MTPLKVPELIREIAFVENSRDLSRLAQVDHFTRAAVTPCLYRQIDISHDSVDSLAVAFRNNPQLVAACRSLSFRYLHGPSRQKEALAESSLDKLYTDLITVFGAISAHGQLAILGWSSRLFRGHFVDYSEDVWTAIYSPLGPLRELDLYISSIEIDMWRSLTRTPFAQLRVLRLYLPDAHGWECAHLQGILDTLTLLEELAMQFPRCCGPSGITLQSTYPYLRRFSFTACSLFAESDFLMWHPGLETLFLDTEQTFSSGTDSSSPNMLRALNVDEYSLTSSPTVVNSQLTHLRLREMDEDPDPIVSEAVSTVASTLRCLELEVDGPEDQPIPPYITALLRAAPALDEVAIIRYRQKPPRNRPSRMLTDLITGLGLRSSEALPQARLDTLGPLPPRLKYIGWDVATAFYGASNTSLVYVVDRLGDRNAVTRTLTRPPADDWVK
ncbi:hypothetical protein B0H19DRAFT_1155397 [Mycena capillaripes]|nr:hypothetical protein B0H19DRAFT_1155397 [Mycena capillaripes]